MRGRTLSGYIYYYDTVSKAGIQETIDNNGFPLPDQVEDKLRGNDNIVFVSSFAKVTSGHSMT
ncbi:hypothetical protein ASZ90_006036 [hydrocarbon metagenome]|uniref:Uncharacterized protein n=1 Tax=hydrocarbon metagenome TaxID=938273 RepID=A0A0W8FTM0_9ZZZZ